MDSLTKKIESMLGSLTEIEMDTQSPIAKSENLVIGDSLMLEEGNSIIADGIIKMAQLILFQ